MSFFSKLLASDRARRVARTVLQLAASALTTYAASTQFTPDQTWVVGAASVVFWTVAHNYVPILTKILPPSAPAPTPPAK
jgi:hypothetical protein